jgi:hypothetical protein
MLMFTGSGSGGGGGGGWLAQEVKKKPLYRK